MIWENSGQDCAVCVHVPLVTPLTQRFLFVSSQSNPLSKTWWERSTSFTFHLLYRELTHMDTYIVVRCVRDGRTFPSVLIVPRPYTCSDEVFEYKNVPWMGGRKRQIRSYIYDDTIIILALSVAQRHSADIKWVSIRAPRCVCYCYQNRSYWNSSWRYKWHLHVRRETTTLSRVFATDWILRGSALLFTM